MKCPCCTSFVEDVLEPAQCRCCPGVDTIRKQSLAIYRRRCGKKARSYGLQSGSRSATGNSFFTQSGQVFRDARRFILPALKYPIGEILSTSVFRSGRSMFSPVPVLIDLSLRYCIILAAFWRRLSGFSIARWFAFIDWRSPGTSRGHRPGRWKACKPRYRPPSGSCLPVPCPCLHIQIRSS